MSGHIDQSGLMTKAINKRRTQDLVLDYLLPSCEREVCCYYDGTRACARGYHIEEELGALFVEADISHFVTDYKIVFLEAGFKRLLGLVRLGFPYLREQVRNGCEVHTEALHTGFYA